MEDASMIPPSDPKWEAQIDRLLKDLPDLAAPPGLVARTMNALAQPVPARWGARPWQAWPAGWRMAFLVLTSCALAVVFTGWRMAVPGVEAAALPWLSRWAADAKCLWNTLAALTGAVPLVVQHLGAGFTLACLLVGAAAYAICIGFGTLIVRFACAPAGKYRL
jgi:hypothetical protein